MIDHIENHSVIQELGIKIEKCAEIIEFILMAAFLIFRNNLEVFGFMQIQYQIVIIYRFKIRSVLITIDNDPKMRIILFKVLQGQYLNIWEKGADLDPEVHHKITGIDNISGEVF